MRKSYQIAISFLLLLTSGHTAWAQSNSATFQVNVSSSVGETTGAVPANKAYYVITQ